MEGNLKTFQSFPSSTKLASVERTQANSKFPCRKQRIFIDKEQKFDLRNVDVPFEFREPFIISGYRKPGISAFECLQSILSTCNETINVWSHIAATIHFIYLSADVWDVGLHDEFVYPLMSLVFGVCTMFIMSFGAHAFNSMSSHTRHVCFFFDYAAISVYTFTAGLAFFFYSRPLNTGWILFESPSLFLSVSAAISLACTYLCCASRHRWIKYKFAMRTGTFLVSFLFNTFPYSCRLLMCSSGIERNVASLPFFKQHCLLYTLAALANVSRLPERFIGKVFDFAGQSHNLLHILAALGAEDEFIALKLDMEERRNLLELSVISPTFWDTLGLTFLVISCNILVVLCFGKSIECEDEEIVKVKVE